MGAVVVRYTTKPERADENQALVEKVFAELAESATPGIHYATFRLSDGVTFVHVARVDTEDGSNPLNTTAAFQAFVANIGDRCEEGQGPLALDASVVGSHNFWPA